MIFALRANVIFLPYGKSDISLRDMICLLRKRDIYFRTKACRFRVILSKRMK